MDRFYKSGASATPPSDPGASSGDFPVPGNPLTATPATKPGAYWYYMMTESLRNVVVAAGLTPNKLSLNLLRDSIIQIVSDRVQSSLTPTGKVSHFMRSSVPSGWVRIGGGTIGDGSSGASERANADCHALFVLLWNEFPQSVMSVVGGRGASAEADWLAHKRLTLLDDQGLVDRAWDYTGSMNPSQTLGAYQQDAIQNITGSFGTNSPNTYDPWGNGAFGTTGSENGLAGTGYSNAKARTITFDASRVVRTATVTRDRSRAYLKCVKL